MKKFYAMIDAIGNVVAHYSDESPAMPYEAIEMTEAEWQSSCRGDLCRDISLGKWAPKPLPVRTVSQARAEKLAALASHRYAVETRGLVVGNVPIATDRESQAMLTGAWVRMQQAPDLWVDWKGSTGWVRIDKVIVDGLAAAVGGHVQACFTAEWTHAEAIASLPADVEVIDGYDFSEGWPG